MRLVAIPTDFGEKAQINYRSHGSLLTVRPQRRFVNTFFVRLLRIADCERFMLLFFVSKRFYFQKIAHAFENIPKITARVIIVKGGGHTDESKLCKK